MHCKLQKSTLATINLTTIWYGEHFGGSKSNGSGSALFYRGINGLQKMSKIFCLHFMKFQYLRGQKNMDWKKFGEPFGNKSQNCNAIKKLGMECSVYPQGVEFWLWEKNLFIQVGYARQNMFYEKNRIVSQKLNFIY